MDFIENIRKEAKNYLQDARGSHNWDHTERVYNLCLRIGKEENIDMEIIKLAAILHDIGREEEDKLNGKVCHAERGAILARQILEKHNVEENKIAKVTHCIESHRFRGDKMPQSQEAKVLFDADKLDSIGAVGIGRTFLFAGEVGARLHNKEVDIEKTKPYTTEDTGYREFVVKLSKIKDKMLTSEGKRIAEERHNFMVNFFNQLNKEVDGIA